MMDVVATNCSKVMAVTRGTPVKTLLNINTIQATRLEEIAAK
ncbi:MAG: hypothetical protein ACWGOV_06115 [Acidiferrobacterales bacterium]